MKNTAVCRLELIYHLDIISKLGRLIVDSNNAPLRVQKDIFVHLNLLAWTNYNYILHIKS